MRDPIERQAAIEAINTWDKFGVDGRGRLVRWQVGLAIYVRLRDVLTAIVNLPSAQPEIIYCKDCVYYRWEIDMCDCPYSTAHNVVHEYDYCSKAKRRTDE